VTDIMKYRGVLSYLHLTLLMTALVILVLYRDNVYGMVSSVSLIGISMYIMGVIDGYKEHINETRKKSKPKEE
jgi:hypothetical protein